MPAENKRIQHRVETGHAFLISPAGRIIHMRAEIGHASQVAAPCKGMNDARSVDDGDPVDVVIFRSQVIASAISSTPDR